MALNNLNVGAYKQVSASGNVRSGPGVILGIFVSAASSTPTLTVYDDAATGTTTKLVDTFTPVAATWYPLPFAFNSGINVVIGGTVSCTVGYAAAAN
jgi:hypothetical protein